MRIGTLFLVVASVACSGCGFQSPSQAPVDALPPPPDGGVAETWRFDSAMEFGAPGHALKDMFVEPRGSLTPAAYTYGGLVAQSLQGTKLWTADSTDWSLLTGRRPAGAGLWRGEQFNGGTSFDYVGITDTRVMTIWFEGEVWLEQGATELFRLRADDSAFLDLARPGTTTYARVMQSGDALATPPVQETGWHPIRIGFGDGDNSRFFEFLRGTSAATLVPWTRDRMRARTGELTGTVRTVFNRQILGGGVGVAPPVPRLELGDLLDTSFNPVPPGVAGTDDWSARYVGQIYIDQPGMYTVVTTSDDGHRVRLGADRVTDAWVRGQGKGNAASTLQTMLGAGWQDLTIDYNQVSATRELHVRLTGGGLTSALVPRTRLRPVEPADDRLAFSTDEAAETINNTGTIISDLPVIGFAGEMVTAIDLTYQIDSDRFAELDIKLERPGAAPVTIRPVGTAATSGVQLFQISIASAASDLGTLLGGPAAGAWKLHIIDGNNAPGGRTIFQSARLTLHTTGGPPTIAPAASWTSPVRAAPTRVFAIDSITWDTRPLPTGARVEAVVRTCAMADCSDDPAWSSPITPGAPFGVEPRPYLQVRVDLFSNGTLEPELKSLNINYRRAET